MTTAFRLGLVRLKELLDRRETQMADTAKIGADPVLAAIQGRAAAVEGPWFFDGYCRVQSEPRLDAYNQWDADTPADLPEDDPRWDAEPETIMAKTQNITSAAKDGKPHGDLGTGEGIANGEFIAHARTDIPLLLAALSEARSRIEQLDERIEELEDENSANIRIGESDDC